MKNFCVKNLLISSHELDDDIIIRFMEAISSTNSRCLDLSDIQYLMKCFLSNDCKAENFIQWEIEKISKIATLDWNIDEINKS